MSAHEACMAARQGILRADAEAQVVSLPMSDGGEGMVQCLMQAIDAQPVNVTVRGPLDKPVQATYAIVEGAASRTAYIEMASAAGLTLVPIDQRNPLLTSTYGVGELLLNATRRGCQHVVIGLGGSATCDGGEGMLRCLAPHLPLPLDVTIASDVCNPLYGPEGAAYVFAPQKGATHQQVKQLDQRLRRFAELTVQRGYATPDLAFAPGAGAAGGLGYGLMAYLGAHMLPGIDLMLDATGFDHELQDVQMIITGEGHSDRQTLMGKVPQGVLRRAQRQHIPVALLSGAVTDAQTLCDAGFAHVLSINGQDKRPLHVLMQYQVASANLAATCESLIKHISINSLKN